MAIKIYKEKMKYLDKMIVELPQKFDPKDYRSTPNVTITWLENCSGKTKIRDQELISDENDHSTGFGKGVSPAHTFLAGFGFSHFTQWGRAAGVLDLEIDSLGGTSARLVRPARRISLRPGLRAQGLRRNHL